MKLNVKRILYALGYVGTYLTHPFIRALCSSVRNCFKVIDSYKESEPTRGLGVLYIGTLRSLNKAETDRVADSKRSGLVNQSIINQLALPLSPPTLDNPLSSQIRNLQQPRHENTRCTKASYCNTFTSVLILSANIVMLCLML